MTYTSIDELPTEVRRAFSLEDANIWMEAYNYRLHDIAHEENATDVPSPQFRAREYAWETCKFLPSSRYVMADVSTGVVDRDRDLADVDSYVEAGQDYVSSGGQVARNHSNKTCGVTWKVFKGLDKESGKECVIACVNFFRGRPLYERVWEEFKARNLEWSIASMVQSKRECNANSCYNRLYPKQWFELSLVDYARNPVTYNIEVNESAKGEAEHVMEMHDEECPILKKYRMFKEHMKAHGVDAHIVEGGVMMLTGGMSEEVEGHIRDEYPEHLVHHEKLESGEEICLLIPHVVDTPDDFLRDMVALIEDEREAISGYHNVMKSLAEGRYLDGEELDKAASALDEVIHDEENHIGVVLGVIKIIDPELYSSIADGVKEAEEATKGCPAGQHEHAGVVGCHDIFRKHSIDYQTNPMDKLDLTDEHIDVNAIKNTPTPKLKEIVTRIARVLTRFDEKAVKEFMSHTQGKEFVLAYLELKRRQTQGDNGMSESDTTKESAPAVAEQTENEADKGLVADPQTSIATIASTLASLTALMDGINTRLMRMEATIASQTEEKNGDITQSILGDPAITGGQPESAAPVGAPAPAGTEEKAEPPAVPDAPNADAGAESEDSSNPFPPKDEKSEDEKKDDGGEKKDASEEKKDAPSDDKKEDDKKDFPPKKKDDEAKKGSEEPVEPTEKAEPVEEMKDDAPAEVKTETPVEEVKEEEKCDAKPEVVVKAEPSESVPEAKVEPVKEQVEEAHEEHHEAHDEHEAHEEHHHEEFHHPVPHGGNAMDFGAILGYGHAVEARQAELADKGVQFNVANGSSSLAQQTTGVKNAGGVTLVSAPNVSAFNGVVTGSAKPTYVDMWSQMGRYDNKTFLNMLHGSD